MGPQELLALAECCEKADGPDRELDARIWLALPEQADCEFVAYASSSKPWRDFGVSDVVNPDSYISGLIFRRRGKAQAFSSSWPAYTGSYDAAMSLVPTDGSMKLVEFSFTTEPDQPQVWPAASVRWYPPFKSGPDWHGMVVSASTLILTICAAALRSLATSRSQHEGASS